MAESAVPAAGNAGAAPAASSGHTLHLPDGTSLHYDLHGSPSSPQKLLLIMGLLTDGAAWGWQSSFFAARGFEVVTYDNRGVARSSTPPMSKLLTYTTKQMAMDAINLAAHLRWDRYHVVGVSMGGMIAMQLALMVPTRVRSLTLAVTHAGGIGARAPWSGIRRMVVSLFSRDEKTRLRAVMKMLYSKDTLANKELTDKLTSHHVERMKTRIVPQLPAVLGHILAVYRHYVSYSDLLNIRYSAFPTLVVVGEEDQLVRRGNSHMLAHVLGARLEVIPSGGHGLFAEYPDKLNAILHDFFLHATDTAGTAAERRARDVANAEDNDDADTEAEEAAEQLVGEADEEEDNAQAADNQYTLEKRAIQLACSHSVHCAMHNVSGFVTAFIPAFAFRWVFWSSISVSTSPSSTRLSEAVRFGLLVGALRGSVRAIRCILHAWRARRWVLAHGLVAPKRNNQPQAATGSAASAAALTRKGLPAGLFDSMPLHSIAFLGACVGLLWQQRLLHGLLKATE